MCQCANENRYDCGQVRALFFETKKDRPRMVCLVNSYSRSDGAGAETAAAEGSTRTWRRGTGHEHGAPGMRASRGTRGRAGVAGDVYLHFNARKETSQNKGKCGKFGNNGKGSLDPQLVLLSRSRLHGIYGILVAMRITRTHIALAIVLLLIVLIIIGRLIGPL